MSKSVLPLFSSKSFVVYGLTVKSLIHFEFIFVYIVRECSDFIPCSCPVFPAPLTEETVFTVYSYLLCHILGDHRCVGLFLDVLSSYIDLYFCFCASAILF